jgi:geranylgeranyl diphosphate synthase type I
VRAGAGPLDLDGLRRRVDADLRGRLREVRERLAILAPGSTLLVDEVVRLLDAGGKRMRPVLCLLGHAAAGGSAEDALPAASGLELFHTFALIHDDVMDEEDERRGEPTTHRQLAKSEPGGERFGRSAAILVGDLALALSLDLVLACRVPAERRLAAAARFRDMTVATAAGQLLDLSGGGDRTLVASLKTGAYTAEAPLAIGAELAGASKPTLDALAAFGRPLGVAFQLLDDVADGDAPPGASERARRLLDEASGALATPPIDAAAAEALRSVAARLRRGASETGGEG